MDWGLIMSGALGGGARAVGEMADDTIKRRDLDLAQQRAEQVAIKGEERRAMLQRENAAYEMDLKLRAQNAPLNRLGAKAQEMAGQQIPVDAAKVTSLDGFAPDSGHQTRGLIGSIDSLKKPAGFDSWSPEDKAGYMAQLESQTKDQQAKADQSVVGQTRKRTPDEAFSAALEDSKVNDLAAYAAGRPLATDKTLAVADGAAIIDQKTGRVIFQNGNKATAAATLEDGRNARSAADRESRERIAAGNTKAPAGYRVKENGDLEFIPGGPADKTAAGGSGKPLPISAAKGFLENQTNLRRAQTALALVNGETVDGAMGDGDATGWKGLVPNQVLNRMDAKGVDTRAAIADLGSLVIHDRSGAAVTASEFPRLAPFIPTATDDAATVKKKLGLFTKNYQAIVDDAAEFYRASGYNVPTQVLKNGKANVTPSTQQSGATGGWGIREVK